MAIKAQPTLRGFNAYVLARLVEARGLTVAEVAAWMIEQWIDQNMELLEARYGVSVASFEQARTREQDPSGSGE